MKRKEWTVTVIPKLAAVALANKTARIVWAVMMRGEAYRAKEVFEQPA